MRGSKGALIDRSAGIRFRLTPIRNLRMEAHDPRRDFDLNADVAAALLGVTRSSVWRFHREGRRRNDGQLIMLKALHPYGSIRSRAYYRLVDIEEFAATAYATKRDVRYELIPHWYAVKHHRYDLIDGEHVKPEPVESTPRMETHGLDPDERAAVDLGYPRGSYLDGDNVYSLSGVWLNPPADETPSIRDAAEAEIKSLKENT